MDMFTFKIPSTIYNRRVLRGNPRIIDAGNEFKEFTGSPEHPVKLSDLYSMLDKKQLMRYKGSTDKVFKSTLKWTQVCIVMKENTEREYIGMLNHVKKLRNVELLTLEKLVPYLHLRCSTSIVGFRFIMPRLCDSLVKLKIGDLHSGAYNLSGLYFAITMFKQLDGFHLSGTNYVNNILLPNLLISLPQANHGKKIRNIELRFNIIEQFILVQLLQKCVGERFSTSRDYSISIYEQVLGQVKRQNVKLVCGGRVVEEPEYIRNQ